MDSEVALTGFFIFAASDFGACALSAAAPTARAHTAAAAQTIAFVAFMVRTDCPPFGAKDRRNLTLKLTLSSLCRRSIDADLARVAAQSCRRSGARGQHRDAAVVARRERPRGPPAIS